MTKALSSVIKRYQALSSVIKRYQALSSVIKRYQALSSVIKRYQALSSVIKRYQNNIYFLSNNKKTLKVIFYNYHQGNYEITHFNSTKTTTIINQ